MWELIPIAVGLALGPVLTRPTPWRAAAVAGVALVVGTAVAAAAGELSESPLFALWDAAQLMVAAVLSAVALRRLARRRA